MMKSLHTLFLLAVVGILSVTVSNGQHRVSMAPLDGNISYDYPISSRTINGQSVDVRLAYSANVTQLSFGEFTPRHWANGDWVPDSWPRSIRMHGE